MVGYLKRLLASSAAYQAAGLLSAFMGVLTLPLYTRHLTPSDYGYAETLLTFVIFGSIFLRFGLGESFMRFWFDDEDERRRVELTRTTVAVVGATSTLAALAGIAFAGPLSDLLLGTRDATLMAFGLVGLWAFTNLEITSAMLRVEERRRAYVIVGCSNVVLTVATTVVLVVGFDLGARGYVAGNYMSSALVLLVLWASFGKRVLPMIPRKLGPLMRFGIPTVPADATVFLLNVIDRAYLLRTQSAAAAGIYAVAIKLSTAVIVLVRGFQAAWPPLAYSVSDDAEAKRLYAFVTTVYVLVTGLGVAAITLLGRWLVRLLAAPEFFEAHEALPWLALGWALYGLNLVFVTVAGRAKITTRNFPAAVAGVAVNTVVLVALVDPLGIAGAGIALCGGYVVMLVVIYVLTKDLFRVPFEWRRLGALVGLLAVVSVAGELLLPESGADGFAARTAALAVIPVALLAGGFLTPAERARLRRLLPGKRQ